MEKYCYSKDVVLSPQELLAEMDLELFFKPELSQNNSSAVRKLLGSLGIYSNDIDYETAQITVRMAPVENFDFTLRNVSNRYYDKDDKLFSQFSIKPTEGTLLSLEGEIYESLNLDLESAAAFRKEHNYEEHIYPETTSLIHFKGIEYKRLERMAYEETIRNMKDRKLTDKQQQILEDMHEKTKGTKEIYITKAPRRFQFYYNGPHIFNNISFDSSLSAEEIALIQNRILELLMLNGKKMMRIDLDHIEESRNDNEQFLEYVYAYLAQYRKIVENKGYQAEQVDVMDSNSLEMIKECMSGSYPNGLLCKVTIITDTPIQTTEEKNNQFFKKFMQNNE